MLHRVFNRGAFCLHHTGPMYLKGSLSNGPIESVPFRILVRWDHICQFFLHRLWPLCLIIKVFWNRTLSNGICIGLLIIEFVCQKVLILPLAVNAELTHFYWTLIHACALIWLLLTVKWPSTDIGTRHYHLWRWLVISLNLNDIWWHILCHAIIRWLVPFRHEFAGAAYVGARLLRMRSTSASDMRRCLVILILLEIHNIFKIKYNYSINN